MLRMEKVRKPRLMVKYGEDFGKGRGPDRVAPHEWGERAVHGEPRGIAVGEADAQQNKRDPAIQSHLVFSFPGVGSARRVKRHTFMS